MLMTMHISRLSTVASAGLAAAFFVSTTLFSGCVSTGSQRGSQRAASAAQSKGGEGTARASEASARRADTAAGAMTAAPGVVYFPTGTPSGAVLTLGKEVSSPEANVGVPFEYRIKVTNVTGNALDGVKVTESLDAGFTLDSTIPDGTRAGNVLSFDLGSMGPNESKTIVLKGTGSKPGVITNCSSVTYAVASCFAIKVTQPSLALSKTISPSMGLTCDEIVAKIVVTNNGTGTARNVIVDDKLPAGLLTADGRSALRFDAGMLEPGEAKEFEVQLKASKSGTYESEATATAAGGLTAQASPVSVVVKQPVVTIVAESPEGEQYLGRPAVFRFEVRNTGDGDCTATEVIANVGPGEFVSADNGGGVREGKLRWNLGKLAPGESKIVSATYTMMTPGKINATAMVNGRCAEPASAASSTTVIGVADIGSLLTDTAGVTAVGVPQVYTCKVVNQGQIDLTDVTVVGTWPVELGWISQDHRVRPVQRGQMATWNFGTLKPKQEITWTFKLQAKKAGEYVIHTSTSAKEMKNTTEMDEITTFVD